MVDAETFADEVAWMARLKAGQAFNTLTHTVQVTTLLGAIQLRRTDFYQWRESVVPATGAGQDSITVDATKLRDQLRRASGQAIVTIDDGWLSIALKDETIRLRDREAEYPEWPRFTSTSEAAVIGTGQLQRALTSVSQDETLPALTAVSFDGGSMVTTDRFRLSRVVYDKKGFNTLVPGVALAAFSAGNNVISVEPGTLADGKTSMVRVYGGGREIITPVVDASFPKWRQLIPDETAVNVMLRRDELLAAVQSERVILTIGADQSMRVVSSDGEDLEIIREVAVTVIEGADKLPFTVQFQTKLLTECLRNVTGGMVQLSANTAAKPVLLRDVGEDDADLHLLMPVREAG